MELSCSYCNQSQFSSSWPLAWHRCLFQHVFFFNPEIIYILEPDKQAKVRHYNSEEVRKFIAKKKDERLRKAKEDKMAMVNQCMKRQEMLQEVYRKQREATAAQRRDGSSSRCKSVNDCTKSDFKDRVRILCCKRWKFFFFLVKIGWVSYFLKWKHTSHIYFICLVHNINTTVFKSYSTFWLLEIGSCSPVKMTCICHW